MFYIDLFLEQNFLMNLIVLELSYLLCRCQTAFRRLRLLLSGLCGAIACALLVLFAPGYVWAVLGMALLVVPAMLFVAFGWNGRRDFLRRLLISWFSIVLLNGVAEALQNITGMRALTFYGGIAVLFVAHLLVVSARASIRRQHLLYPVTLYHRERSADCLALYDSGNLLAAADGEPVHIISPQLSEQLGIGEGEELNLIPFQSLGAKEGWIRVVKVEKIRVGGGAQAHFLSGVCLGIAEEGLFLGKSYRMILNGGLEQGKGVVT